jgi:hypothetical protein
MRRLKVHPQLADYWARTWSSALRLRWWRLNPVKVSFHLVRDTRQAVVFLVAMVRETY